MKVMTSLKWQKTYAMMQELEEIEIKLPETYKACMWKKEKEAVAGIRKNPKFFYSYSKKHRNSNIIGPFIMNGELVREIYQVCETLKQKYESVWSQPNPAFKIVDPEAFFQVRRGPSMMGSNCGLPTCKTCPDPTSGPSLAPPSARQSCPRPSLTPRQPPACTISRHRTDGKL